MVAMMMMRVSEAMCRADVFGVILLDDSMGDHDRKGDQIIFQEHPEGIKPPYNPNRPYLVRVGNDKYLCKIRDMGDKVRLEFNNVREAITVSTHEVVVYAVGLESHHSYL